MSENCEFSKALDYFDRALEINVATNVPWGISAIKAWIAMVNIYQGNIDLGYAQFFERKKDPSKAIEKMSKAIETFKECGADGWVDKGEKKLAEF